MIKHYWTETETLRVLELFLLRGCVVLNKTDADVVELSRQLAYEAEREGKETYPSPNSIAMKAANFMSLYTGTGLSHTSALDKQIWEQYASRLLTSEDSSLRQGIEILANPIEAEEGSVVSVMHLLRERDHSLIREKKRLARQRGPLKCSLCGFDFEKIYGDLGCNFIEVHHLTPLATYNKLGQSTSLDDLILVCSNCHRMLHRINKPNAVEVLNHILQRSKREQKI